MYTAEYNAAQEGREISRLGDFFPAIAQTYTPLYGLSAAARRLRRRGYSKAVRSHARVVKVFFYTRVISRNIVFFFFFSNLQAVYEYTKCIGNATGVRENSIFRKFSR